MAKLTKVEAAEMVRRAHVYLYAQADEMVDRETGIMAEGSLPVWQAARILNGLDRVILARGK